MSEPRAHGPLQLIQTILVAVLLGVTGWVAQATVENQKAIVALQTKMEERKSQMEELRQSVANLQIRAQSGQDKDAETERRLTVIELRLQQRGIQ